MTAHELIIVAGLLLGLAATVALISLCMRSTFNALWVRNHGTRITETEINFMGKDRAYHLLARWEDPHTHRIYTFRSDPGSIIEYLGLRRFGSVLQLF